jgi:hypothetical protein
LLGELYFSSVKLGRPAFPSSPDWSSELFFLPSSWKLSSAWWLTGTVHPPKEATFPAKYLKKEN